jgi:hypothetical protein
LLAKTAANTKMTGLKFGDFVAVSPPGSAADHEGSGRHFFRRAWTGGAEKSG